MKFLTSCALGCGLLLLATSVASCGDEPGQQAHPGAGEAVNSIPMEFTASVFDDTLPQRSLVESSADMHGRLLVSAYHYTGSWHPDLMNSSPNYFANKEANRSADGTYRLKQTHFWPVLGKIRFVCYAPVYPTSLIPVSVNGRHGLKVRLPDQAEKQPDLLLAITPGVKVLRKPGTVPLHFKHLLSAVRFRCDQSLRGLTVTAVRLKEVFGSAVFVPNSYLEQENLGTSAYDGDRAATNWSAYDEVRTFSKEVKHTVSTDADQGFITALSGKPLTFMMLPQQLPAQAAVEVDLTFADGTMRTCSASIGDRQWQGGIMTVYRISTQRSKSAPLITAESLPMS